MDDDELLEFFNILNEMDVDFDDLGIDPEELNDFDTNDLNNVLDAIELPDEEDEIEIFLGDPDEEDEEEEN